MDLTSCAKMQAAPLCPVADVEGRDAKLLKSARDLESNFLAEMLKQSGFGSPVKDFGGGVGEEAFSSFAVDQVAAQLEARGGLGLAERIYERLKRIEDR